MNLKKLGCTAFLIFSFSQSLNLLTACSDWNDHYENTAEGGAASGTLWQQLKANPQTFLTAARPLRSWLL